MIKVEYELKKEKENTLKNSTEVILETNRLLGVGSSADEEILKNSGLSHQITTFEGDKKTTFVERQAMDKKYEGDIFTDVEIKAMCVKYGLRFLHASKYCGAVASHVPQKLREFCEKNNIGTGTNLESQSYVMAMDRDFRLQDQPKPPKPQRDPEPLLFYKVDTGQYKLIAKWGRDLTIWNYIKAFRRRNEPIYMCSNMIILTILLNIIMFSIFPFVSLWSILPIIVVSVVAVVVYWASYLEDNSYKFTRDTIWNTNERLKGI